jgi:hypothetical protein
MSNLEDSPITLALRQLFDDTHLPHQDPPPSLNSLLSGRCFASADWDDWMRYIPSEVEDQWATLSTETKIVAYSVAAKAIEVIRDLQEDS